MFTPSTPVSEISEQQTTTPQPTQEVLAVQDEKKTYKVTRIIDGDTIEIDNDGTPEKIRLLGIDTPEEGECYFDESKNKLSSFVLNKNISIEYDTVQGKTDRYGRTLAHIFINEIFINKAMVRKGFAEVYTNQGSTYLDQLKEEQQKAQNLEIGLWSDVCNPTVVEVTSTPTPSPTQAVVYQTPVSTPYPTQNPTYTPTPTPAVTSCLYDCNGPDKDCSDFSTHYQAQTFFNCCGFTAQNDPMRLDGAYDTVDDGIACESLP